MSMDTQTWSIEEAVRIIREKLNDSTVQIILFGSRARGSFRRFSDIDIALNASGKPISNDKMAIINEAMEESLIPFKVDVVDLTLLNENFRQNIEREGIVLATPLS